MTIEEKVKQIVIDTLHCEEQQIKPEANFVNDLGADSLDRAELVMNIEDAFKDVLGASIDESDAEKLETVGSVVEFLRAKGAPETL